uniref:zinc-finger homeodomain protein 10-like n=1 Tax=Podarcis muralis TaxID=64176 RepID=UPI00109F7DFE|nr:zinc-finger homeodomain protein 10-like [Podarcis muralis]
MEYFTVCKMQESGIIYVLVNEGKTGPEDVASGPVQNRPARGRPRPLRTPLRSPQRAPRPPALPPPWLPACTAALAALGGAARPAPHGAAWRRRAPRSPRPGPPPLPLRWRLRSRRTASRSKSPAPRKNSSARSPRPGRSARRLL